MTTGRPLPTEPHAIAWGTAAILLLAFTTSCSTTRAARPIAVPAADRIYVSVFVDETDRGEVGVPVSEALRLEIYRRDPSRLAMSFDQGAVAVDGTVLAVEERPAGAGRLAVVVSAGVTLVNKAGQVVVELGTLEGVARYSPARESAETEARRQEALAEAVQELARQILRQVDRAGREEARHEPIDA